ncbi:MAG: hypothetical protein SVZ03_01595 [Spirochaetota bacterium]|nr:hypothetical protein [Spirochaetota bacterium]
MVSDRSSSELRNASAILLGSIIVPTLISLLPLFSTRILNIFTYPDGYPPGDIRFPLCPDGYPSGDNRNPMCPGDSAEEANNSPMKNPIPLIP